MSRHHSLSTYSSSKTNICQHTSSKPLRIAVISGAIVLFFYLYAYQQKFPIQTTPLQVWHRSEQRIKRPTHINRDHGFCGRCPEDKQLSNAWQLTDLVARLPPLTPFIVNIGAASTGGGIYDPTYLLLAAPNSSFGALLIDPNSNPALFSAYPKRNNVHILNDYIWSESILPNIFHKYNISKQFTLLKVDVDSYECSLLETILSADYRPQLIHTEFNPIFPPPVIFIPIYNSTTKNDWKPALWANTGPFYGCSLSALSKLMGSFDYVLVEVDFWDVIYIQRELAQSCDIQVPANDAVAYEHGFAKHSCSPYCQQNSKLYNNRINSAIKSGMNQPNFTSYMTTVMDQFAPRSVKNNLKHPYIITL